MASTPVIKIAIFGDDEMMGSSFGRNGMLTFVTPDEAQSLQALLQTRFNDSGIEVVNLSSGGTSSTLPNELDGMDGGGAAEPQRMRQSGAMIAIQEHAINDNLDGETTNEYAAYLGQWIVDAQASGLTPILEEPGPVCDGNHPRLAQYVQAMNVAAVRYHVPIIQQYDAISSLDGWQSHMLNCITPDAMLTADKAAREEAIIAPIVDRLIGEDL